MEYEEKKYGNWPPFGKELPMLSIICKENSIKRTMNVSHNGYRSAIVSSDQEINSLNNSSDLSKEKTEEGNGLRNPGFVNDEI
ncbi:hypothetical protein EAI_12122 [Harpegnathos saltator]|uniref:Uncharacterized protein n=2 Tax=Harpegnathos saltator TaxID=610380 RepID=E2BZ63_HARSA|nr:hypothetical protein EAI_12122 [Harpegnathos saltator]